MSQATRGGITRMPQADPRTFDSPATYVPPHLPHGLSLLNSISTLSIKEEANLTQAAIGLLNAKRFQIFNENDQQVLHAAEDNNMAQRFCCGANRTVVLRIYDQSNQEVMKLTREFKCCGGGCCWCADTECCKYEAIIESPPGVIIGTIRQRKTFFRPQFSLKDATGKEHLRVTKPFCICQGMFCCCCENKFKLTTAETDVEVGGIFKEYAGFVNQAITGAEKFTLKVPIELPAHLKAIALGALFIVDYRFFGGNAKSKGGSNILGLCC